MTVGGVILYGGHGMLLYYMYICTNAKITCEYITSMNVCMSNISVHARVFLLHENILYKLPGSYKQISTLASIINKS